MNRGVQTMISPATFAAAGRVTAEYAARRSIAWDTSAAPGAAAIQLLQHFGAQQAVAVVPAPAGGDAKTPAVTRGANVAAALMFRPTDT